MIRSSHQRNWNTLKDLLAPKDTFNLRLSDIQDSWAWEAENHPKEVVF